MIPKCREGQFQKRSTLGGYRYPQHEERIERIAREIGFSQISVSHRVSPMMKLLDRKVGIRAGRGGDNPEREGTRTIKQDAD